MRWTLMSRGSRFSHTRELALLYALPYGSQPKHAETAVPDQHLYHLPSPTEEELPVANLSILPLRPHE